MNIHYTSIHIHQIIHNIYTYISIYIIHTQKALCKMWDFHITRPERRIPKKHHQPSSWQLLRNLPGQPSCPHPRHAPLGNLGITAQDVSNLPIGGTAAANKTSYHSYIILITIGWCGQQLHWALLEHDYWTFLFWFRRVPNGATRCWEMLSQSHSHPKVWDVVHEYC